MKRILYALGLLVLLAGCSSEKSAAEDLHKPAIENEGLRAGVGTVFYEDDSLIGIEIDGVGTYLYNLKDKKLQNQLRVRDEKLDGYFSVPEMSEDKKSLVYHFEERGQGTIAEKVLRYDIKDNKLYVLENRDSIPVAKTEWVEMEVDPEKQSEWLHLENVYHTTKSGEKVYPFAEDMSWKQEK